MRYFATRMAVINPERIESVGQGGVDLVEITGVRSKAEAEQFCAPNGLIYSHCAAEDSDVRPATRRARTEASALESAHG